jgi:hypothetical protein
MRERLNIRGVNGLRPVVNAKANKWRRTARRMRYDLHRNAQHLGLDEWFLLALMVVCGMAIGYQTLMTSTPALSLW